MTDPAARGGPLDRATLLAYGLPGLPGAVFVLPVYIHLPSYYADDLGLGFTAVGAVLLAARLWDVVTDPVIGTLGDRTRGRLGRRRPWIAAAVPLALLAIWRLFLPPAGIEWTFLLAWSFVFYVAYTMLQLPYLAWGAELAGDYHERSRIAGAREGFALAGTVVALALPVMLGRAAPGPSLAVLGLFVMATLPIGVAVLLWRVPEPPPRLSGTVPWRDGVRTLVGNRPFRRLLLAYLANGVANGLPTTLVVSYVRYNLEAEEMLGGFLLLYFAAAVVGLPVWLALARRIGKHRAWVAAMGWSCLWFAWAPVLGPGDTLPFLGLCLATGLALGADLALPAAIQADVVDVDTAESGATRTGLYFGLWGMATKLSFALAVGLAFPLLDLAGFDPDGGGGRRGLWLLVGLYGLAPVAFKLAAAGLVWRFPVDAAAQRALAARIAARGEAS